MVDESVVGGLVKDLLVVGRSVEDLSVGRWSVVGDWWVS